MAQQPAPDGFRKPSPCPSRSAPRTSTRRSGCARSLASLASPLSPTAVVGAGADAIASADASSEIVPDATSDHATTSPPPLSDSARRISVGEVRGDGGTFQVSLPEEAAADAVAGPASEMKECAASACGGQICAERPCSPAPPTTGGRILGSSEFLCATRRRTLCDKSDSVAVGGADGPSSEKGCQADGKCLRRQNLRILGDVIEADRQTDFLEVSTPSKEKTVREVSSPNGGKAVSDAACSWESMTVVKLREECLRRGLRHRNLRKVGIISLLVDAQNSVSYDASAATQASYIETATGQLGAEGTRSTEVQTPSKDNIFRGTASVSTASKEKDCGEHDGATQAGDWEGMTREELLEEFRKRGWKQRKLKKKELISQLKRSKPFVPDGKILATSNHEESGTGNDAERLKVPRIPSRCNKINDAETCTRTVRSQHSPEIRDGNFDSKSGRDDPDSRERGRDVSRGGENFQSGNEEQLCFGADFVGSVRRRNLQMLIQAVAEAEREISLAEVKAKEVTNAADRTKRSSLRRSCNQAESRGSGSEMTMSQRKLKIIIRKHASIVARALSVFQRNVYVDAEGGTVALSPSLYEWVKENTRAMSSNDCVEKINDTARVFINGDKHALNGATLVNGNPSKNETNSTEAEKNVRHETKLVRMESSSTVNFEAPEVVVCRAEGILGSWRKTIGVNEKISASDELDDYVLGDEHLKWIRFYPAVVKDVEHGVDKETDDLAEEEKKQVSAHSDVSIPVSDSSREIKFEHRLEAGETALLIHYSGYEKTEDRWIILDSTGNEVCCDQDVTNTIFPCGCHDMSVNALMRFKGVSDSDNDLSCEDGIAAGAVNDDLGEDHLENQPCSEVAPDNYEEVLEPTADPPRLGPQRSKWTDNEDRTIFDAVRCSFSAGEIDCNQKIPSGVWREVSRNLLPHRKWKNVRKRWFTIRSQFVELMGEGIDENIERDSNEPTVEEAGMCDEIVREEPDGGNGQGQAAKKKVLKRDATAAQSKPRANWSDSENKAIIAAVKSAMKDGHIERIDRIPTHFWREVSQDQLRGRPWERVKKHWYQIRSLFFDDPVDDGVTLRDEHAHGQSSGEESSSLKKRPWSAEEGKRRASSSLAPKWHRKKRQKITGAQTPSTNDTESRTLKHNSKKIGALTADEGCCAKKVEQAAKQGGKRGVRQKDNTAMRTTLDEDSKLAFTWICTECREAECISDPKSPLLVCEGLCNRPFHYPCAGLAAVPPKDEKWVCNDCERKRHHCAVCHEYGIDGEDVHKCAKKNCGLFFHERCLTMYDVDVEVVERSVVIDQPNREPSTCIETQPRFQCPAHRCWTCSFIPPVATETAEGENEGTKPKKKGKRRGSKAVSSVFGEKNDQLFRCLDCPISYHVTCIPPACRFHELALLCHEHNQNKLPDLDAEHSYQAEVEAFADEKLEELRNKRRKTASAEEPSVDDDGTDSEDDADMNTFFPGIQGDSVSLDQQKLTNTLYIENEARTSCLKPNQLLFCLPCDLQQEVHSKPPTYTHVHTNRYDQLNRPKRHSPTSERCHCKPSADGSIPSCDERCVNRMIMVECVGDGNKVNGKTNPYWNCSVGPECGNRLLSQRKFAKCRPKREQGRGWGLTAVNGVKTGDLVTEYVGEIIDEETKRERLSEWAQDHPNDPNFYIMRLEPGWYIDARVKGNLSRFINHSCDPNCRLVPVNVAGHMRVAIVAVCNVAPGGFLSYDYRFDTKQGDRFICRCGAANCRGTMNGGRGDQSEKEGRKTKKELFSEAKARYDRDKKFLEDVLGEEKHRLSLVGPALPGEPLDSSAMVASGPQERGRAFAQQNSLFLWRAAVIGSNFIARSWRYMDSQRKRKKHAPSVLSRVDVLSEVRKAHA